MYLVNSVSLYGQITKLHSFLKDTPLQVQFYYKFYSHGILIKKMILIKKRRAYRFYIRQNNFSKHFRPKKDLGFT